MTAVPLLRGMCLALPAVACFLSLAACRFADQDKAELLFSQLPRDQAVLLYLDVEGLRSLPGLSQIIAAEPDGSGPFRGINNDLGIDASRDVDSLAASIGTATLTLAVTGNFNHSRIEQYLSQKGASCSALLGGLECAQESERTTYIVWLDPAQQNFLVVSSGPSFEAIRELRSSREPNSAGLASDMRAGIGSSGFLWLAIDPRRLGVAMRDPPEHWINLSLLANALQHSHRAVAHVGLLADGQIEFRLQALCSSAEEAEKQSSLLKGLFSFAAAALDAGRGEKPAENGWSALLRSAEVTAVETRAEARILLGMERLTQVLSPQ